MGGKQSRSWLRAAEARQRPKQTMFACHLSTFRLCQSVCRRSLLAHKLIPTLSEEAVGEGCVRVSLFWGGGGGGGWGMDGWKLQTPVHVNPLPTEVSPQCLRVAVCLTRDQRNNDNAFCLASMPSIGGRQSRVDHGACCERFPRARNAEPRH